MIEYFSAGRRNSILIHATTCIKPQKHCAQGQKPDTKDYTFYNSICMDSPEEGNL